ncbi:hypothetical protein VTJ83DRAFT_4093 [Remersonia thermophila]|uniref:GTP cyclohydrolase II n=1 Tax=Remersonia thermophila TaxID=72144 RepID=A0ABR4DG58_9PEZI
MPASELDQPPFDGSVFPPFYSPRPDARGGNRDIDDVDFSLAEGKTSPSNSERANATQDALAPSPASLAQPPPPSLLSPAFTPPSTPGTATPRSATLTEPRGIPVDSSIPTGGCGTKHPRLLETLPEVECIVRARIPTTTGAEMFLHLYKNNVDNKEHLAIVFGGNIRSKSLDAVREGETEMDRLVRGAYTGRLYPGRTTSGILEGSADTPSPVSQGPPLVRIHSECYTGETVWSARCDCGEQLDEAARLMSLPSNTAGGIIIYLRQEGRGIGLGEKLKAYNLQDLGSDTVEANLLLRHPADARSYGLATAILLDLGQKEIRLLTNNPDKIRAVEGPHREIVVTERVAMVPLSWKGKGGFRAPEVEGYLKTKIEKMGHLLDLASLPRQDSNQ